MVNNFTAPRWTEEELSILKSGHSLESLEKLLPNRSRDAIRKRLKALPKQTDGRAIVSALRTLVALKIYSAEEVLQIFNITDSETKTNILAPITRDQLRKLVDEGHTSVDIIAAKYNKPLENIRDQLYG